MCLSADNPKQLRAKRIFHEWADNGMGYFKLIGKIL